MKFKKKITTMLAITLISLSSISTCFADGTRVVTLGANLTNEQKATMLKYFGVKKNEVEILEVNNQEERKYLEGVATEAQLGKKTYSCSYVEPTKSGSGINVKTANLTWLTSSMVANVLVTCDVADANVVVAAPFKVSGTGAISGIMKAFEDASGNSLDEDKKEIASEELIITGDLGEDIGMDKATGIINDIKTEIIKNNTSDTTQIAETINNVINNYNITINSEQEAQLQSLMSRISEQDYDYSKIKNTLNDIKDVVNDKLEEMGESVDKSFIDTIKDWFVGLGEWIGGLFKGNEEEDFGILNSTNDSLLGEDAIIDATSENAINLPSSEEVQGFFAKIWDWFIGLFNNDNSEQVQSEIDINEEDITLDSIKESEIIEEDVQAEPIEQLDESLDNVDTIE